MLDLERVQSVLEDIASSPELAPYIIDEAPIDWHSLYLAWTRMRYIFTVGQWQSIADVINQLILSVSFMHTLGC
jgi:hypothetical protein